MKRYAALLAAVVLLWLTARASAMDSANYRLDWFTPLTTAGGGSATSTHYAVNFSLGQTAVSTSTSANYATTLGYWASAGADYYVFLPLVLK